MSGAQTGQDEDFDRHGQKSFYAQPRVETDL